MLALVAVLVLQTPPTSGFSTPEWYAQHGYPCFGDVVGNAGDLDGDECAELVVGDPGSNLSPPDRPISTRFWIVSPKKRACIRRIVLPPDEIAARFAFIGTTDADGDAKPDLLLSRRSYKEGVQPSLWWISGVDGSVVRTIELRGYRTTPGQWVRVLAHAEWGADFVVLHERLDPPRRVVEFRSSRTGAVVRELEVPKSCAPLARGIVDVADLDGDKLSEIALVSDGSATCTGRVELLGTKTGTALWTFDTLWPHPHRFGIPRCIGDVDGDRVSDLSVSVENDGVYLLSGATGKLVRRHERSERTDSSWSFGQASAAPGDLDGDGVPDLVISQPDSPLFGAVLAFSGKQGRPLWSSPPRGDFDLSRYGNDLAVLDDVDGDHVRDLAVGTWEGPVQRAGRAMVVSGKTGIVLFEIRRNGDDVVVADTFPWIPWGDEDR